MLTAFVPHFVRDHFSVRISDTDDSSFTGINSGDAVTFSGMDAGWPRPDRLLIAVIHTRDGTEDASFTRGCTIGGVSATEISYAGGSNGGSTAYVGIFAAVVPTGLTADVAITISGFSGTFDAWGCTLVRATGLASNTSVADGSTFFDPSTVTIDTAGAKFAVIGCADLGSDDLSAKTPYSSSGGSVLTAGHKMQYGLAFIDTNPSGGSTAYSITERDADHPDFLAAACWG